MSVQLIECIVPIALKETMEVLGPQFEAESGYQLNITHMLNPERCRSRLEKTLRHVRSGTSDDHDDAMRRPKAAVEQVGAAATREPPVIKQVVAQILRLPEVDGSKGDSGQDTLIVRVTTECGLVGVGEVEAQPEIAKAIIDAPRSWGGKKIGASGLRAELLGENALDHERLWNKMYDASSFYGRHAVVIQAMAGIGASAS